MSFPRSPAVAVWLLAAAGAASIGDAWAFDARPDKLHPWVLLAVFWGAALLSVSIHYWPRPQPGHAAPGTDVPPNASGCACAWVHAAFMWATVSAAIRRPALRLVRRHSPLARSLAGPRWDRGQGRRPGLRTADIGRTPCSGRSDRLVQSCPEDPRGVNG